MVGGWLVSGLEVGAGWIGMISDAGWSRKSESESCLESTCGGRE